MKRTRVIVGVVVIVAALGGFFGYKAYRQSAQKEALAADMKEFAAAYKDFQEKHGRPPREAESEAVVAGRPEPFRQLVQKEMQIRWGVPLDPKAEAADRKALAFVNRNVGDGKVPTLFQNGEVGFLTLDEVMRQDRVPAAVKKDEPKKQ